MVESQKVARRPHGFVLLPRTNSVRLAIAFFLAGVAALAVDLPIARYVANHDVPPLISKPIRLSEVFAHGWGIVIIACAVYSLDPPGRRFLPRILLAVLVAGVASNAVKLLIARYRPRAFDLDSTVLDSFGPWLPLFPFNSDSQSLPSAHVAVAVAFAVALGRRYPRGKLFFAISALLAAMQRVQAEAHFTSDVFWGAAVGVACACACLPNDMSDCYIDPKG